MGQVVSFAAPLANWAPIVTYLPRLLKVLNVAAKYRLDEFLRGRRRMRPAALAVAAVPRAVQLRPARPPATAMSGCGGPWRNLGRFTSNLDSCFQRAGIC